ncbi:alpha/beta hydrolase [Streptomyces sp. NPDC056304]|uniref:alpha/beta hydrolase n=1 Tax=Streptomyces sp. NPDC056304 TaxID=3345778 RepID=UPI0035E06359
MPFAPELKAELENLGAPQENAPTSADDIPRWRAQLTTTDPSLKELRDHGRFEIQEFLAPGPDGAPDVSLLFARPTGLCQQAPVIYHMHGGGMIGGSNRTGMQTILHEWAEPLELAVVSVGYRLAPEHPYPAAIEDCYAGLLWLARHAGTLGVDRRRVIAVGGSAGGGLTAALALMARDRKGPGILGQLLMCPMLDDRNDSPSAHQMTGLGVWDRRANSLAWTALLGKDRESSQVSYYAAAARAADLSQLPPTYVDAGAAETFRDECIQYATRIWQAGGDAELHVWSGGFHGFDQLAPHAEVSRDARRSRFRWLCRLLSREVRGASCGTSAIPAGPAAGPGSTDRR